MSIIKITGLTKIMATKGYFRLDFHYRGRGIFGYLGPNGPARQLQLGIF